MGRVVNAPRGKWQGTRRPSGDAGTTLIDLIVGMGIMSIFMGIFTASMLSMYSSTNKTLAVHNSSAELNTAFDRLDKQVRYAAVIDQPKGPSTDPSVRFLRTDLPTPTCTQLKIRTVVDANILQLVERTWEVSGNGSAIHISGWNQLAAGLSLTDQNGTDVRPFDVKVPTGGTVQRLELHFVVIDGAGKSATRSFSEITFSAMNSGSAARSMLDGSPETACDQPEIP